MRRIAFLFVGQMRKNGLSSNSDINSEILESFEKNIFNSRLNSYCKYDIYFVTDSSIDINKTKKFFNKAQNIDITIDTVVPECNSLGYEEKAVLVQFRKMRLGLEKIKTSEITYDYICKLRPDVPYFNEFTPSFELLDNSPKIEVLFSWDVIVIGRIDIMYYYLNLEEKLGTVFEERFEFECNGMFHSRFKYEEFVLHVPTIGEIQSIDLTMDYIIKKGLTIDDSIKDARIDFQFQHLDRSHFTINGYT